MTVLTKLRNKPRLYYWLPVLLWMALIFIVSSRSNLPSHPNKTVDFTLRKAGHLVEYGVLAFLLWRAISKERGAPAPLSFGGAFAFSLLYAASDEFHQTFVPGRDGTLLDLGFDALGALLALGLIRWSCKDNDFSKEALLLDLNAPPDQLQDGQESDDYLQA